MVPLNAQKDPINEILCEDRVKKARKHKNPPWGLGSPYWSLLTLWNPVAYCPLEDTYPLPAWMTLDLQPLGSARPKHSGATKPHNQNKGGNRATTEGSIGNWPNLHMFFFLIFGFFPGYAKNMDLLVFFGFYPAQKGIGKIPDTSGKTSF